MCREYQRGNCKRAESECRFAHPPEHVTVDSAEGTVTVCMDFVKGRCSRDLCRYFHPTPHLQAQLKAAQSRANAAANQAAMVGKNTILAYLPLSLSFYLLSPSVHAVYVLCFVHTKKTNHIMHETLWAFLFNRLEIGVILQFTECSLSSCRNSVTYSPLGNAYQAFLRT